MKTSACIFSVAILSAAPALADQAAETIGYIQTLDGQAFIQRGGATHPAVTGAALQRNDLIRTGKPGAVGIVLTDDTTVALGSGSELSLNEYVFEPKQGKFALAIKMIKGSFSYITGQIVKLAPDAARVLTPDATIAVRGTKLLVQIKE